MWKWYDSKVIKIENQSPTTKRFWVEVPELESIDFQAGQFVTMDLPISEKRRNRWRSYSIANDPNGTNVLEFCIVYLKGGLATEYLFNEIKVGSTIKFKGPSGGFVLKEPVERDLVLICTGTGVAPFRSMILDIFNNEKTHQNIHLIFGTREEEGILYRDEFELLEEKMPNFKYSVALSRAEDWQGYKGYVHKVYEEYYKEVDPNRHFYLCGWSNMIDEAVEKLILEMGYDKSQVHYELYG
ncbi:MAG: ferredoxin--NADP reductase [Saprospiraceae bacterium]